MSKTGGTNFAPQLQVCAPCSRSNDARTVENTLKTSSAFATFATARECKTILATKKPLAKARGVLLVALQLCLLSPWKARQINCRRRASSIRYFNKLSALSKLFCTAAKTSERRLPSTKQWLTVMFSNITYLPFSKRNLSQPMRGQQDDSKLLSGSG